MFELLTEASAAEAADPGAAGGGRGGLGSREWEPGPELAAALETLDSGAVGVGEAVSVLVAAQRMVSHYQAKLYAAMVAVRDRYRSEDPDGGAAREGAAAEIAAALSLTRAAAREELATAETLVDVLPRLGDTLDRGRLDLRRCRVVIDETRHLSDEAASQVLDQVLDRAQTQTTGPAAGHPAAGVPAGRPRWGDRTGPARGQRAPLLHRAPEGAGTIMVLDVAPEAAQEASDRG